MSDDLITLEQKKQLQIDAGIPHLPTDHLIADARAKALRFDKLTGKSIGTRGANFYSATAELLREMAYKLETMK